MNAVASDSGAVSSAPFTLYSVVPKKNGERGAESINPENGQFDYLRVSFSPTSFLRLLTTLRMVGRECVSSKAGVALDPVLEVEAEWVLATGADDLNGRDELTRLYVSARGFWFVRGTRSFRTPICSFLHSTSEDDLRARIAICESYGMHYFFFGSDEFKDQLRKRLNLSCPDDISILIKAAFDMVDAGVQQQVA